MTWTALTMLAALGVQGADTIPFELVRDQVLVQVTIDGDGPYTFLIDTGVNPSGLDLAVARARGLLDGEEPIGHAGGVGSQSIPIYAATLRHAGVGSLRVEVISAAAMDMSALGRRLGRPLHGILGYSFLTNRRIRFDYPNRRLIVGGEPPSGGYGEPAFHDRLEFVEGDTMPLVPVAVNGETLFVSVDTGSSLVLELYPDGAARAGVHAAGRTDSVMGARGTEAVRSGLARSIRLGGLERRDQAVTLVDHQRPGNRMGNLGNGFLKHYVLTVDYARGTITLEPAAERP